MRNIVIFVLFIITLAFYLLYETQNDHIKSLQNVNSKLNDRYEALQFTKMLHSKINKEDLVFYTKLEAEQEILNKISFYKEYFNLKLQTNVLEKDNKFFIDMTIEDDIEIITDILDFLKDDSHLKLLNFRQKDDTFSIRLRLEYYFVREE